MLDVLTYGHEVLASSRAVAPRPFDLNGRSKCRRTERPGAVKDQVAVVRLATLIACRTWWP